METIFCKDMYARHDVIIESACLWLEDVHSVQSPAGSLALGQNQECYGGCFSPADALDGDLANLHVWSRVLSQVGVGFLLLFMEGDILWRQQLQDVVELMILKQMHRFFVFGASNVLQGP